MITSPFIRPFLAAHPRSFRTPSLMRCVIFERISFPPREQTAGNNTFDPFLLKKYARTAESEINELHLHQVTTNALDDLPPHSGHSISRTVVSNSSESRRIQYAHTEANLSVRHLRAASSELPLRKWTPTSDSRSAIRSCRSQCYPCLGHPRFWPFLRSNNFSPSRTNVENRIAGLGQVPVSTSHSIKNTIELLGMRLRQGS